MRLTRIYLPGSWRADDSVPLPDTACEHLTKVLRARAGLAFRVFDGAGREHEARLEQQSRAGASARIGVAVPGALLARAPLAIRLLQSVTRGEKMDWVLQKATELGVSTVQPVLAERCVVHIDDERQPARLSHWRKVAVAACEQSGRVWLPDIRPPLGLTEACEQVLQQDELLLALDPEATQTLAAVVKNSEAGPRTAISLLIGPEGGLSEAELRWLRQSAAKLTTLGPRILRTETAAIAAVTAIQLLAGDFG